MKKRSVLMGILALALVFGFVIAGCDNGSTSSGGGDGIWKQLTAGTGTWEKGDTTLEFHELDGKKYANDIKVYLSGDPLMDLPANGISFGGGSSDSGTISVSGTTMTLAIKSTSYYADYNGTYTKK